MSLTPNVPVTCARDLMRLMDEGQTAELLFVVQREGCTSFAPADEIDPEYGKLLRRAYAAGVQVRALVCEIDPGKGVTLSARALKLEL